MFSRTLSLAVVLSFMTGSATLAAQDSPGVSALESKGQTLLRQGRAAEGIKAYEEAVQLAEKEYGADDDRTLLLRGGLALALQAAGRFDDAVTLYQKVAAAAEAKYGPNDPQTYLALGALGKLYNTASRYDDALDCLKRALKGLDATLEPDHIAILDVLESLLATALNAGRTIEAEPYIRRKIKILEVKNGPHHPDVVTAQIRLMLVLMNTDRLAEADAYIQRAYEALKARPAADQVQVARLQNELAKVKSLKGDHAGAEQLLKEARKVLEQKLGPDAPETWKVIGSLGALYTVTGRFDEAEPLLRQCLTNTQGRFGLINSDTLESYVQLSGLLAKMGRADEARQLLEQALDATVRTVGPKHPIAIGFRGLLSSLGDPKGPKMPVLTRPEIERAFGKESPEGTMGAVLEVMKLINARRFAEAEPLIKQSLATVQKTLGDDHPVAAVLLSGLSMTSLVLGRYKESEEHARRALKIYDAKFGQDHPETASCREVLAMALVALHRALEALDLLDAASRARRRILDRTLPALSEGDQIALLHTSFTGGFNIAMGAAWSLRDRRGVPAQSAAWVLNHKALAFAALAQRAILARDSREPRIADIVAKLNDTRQRLAALASPGIRLTGGADAGPREQIEQLVAREHELSRDLSLTLKRPPPGDPWIEVDAVRGALPSDAVLIEFASYAIGSTGNVPSSRYSAWVIPAANGGSVRLIDLGESGPIDEAIAAVRQGMRLDRTASKREGAATPRTDDRSGLTRPGGEQSGRETELEAEKRLAPALANLARLLIKPLCTHVDSARRWLISPDSSLWLVPWQALPLDDGRYAIERHLIHLVVSGRDLVTPAGDISAAPPVHFADPDFDLAQPDRAPTSPPVAAPGGPTAAEIAAVNRALSDGFHAARLPGTGTEADGVYPLLAQYTSARPVLYKQADATEARFRELRRPRVLILSTHGFFLDQSEPSSSVRLPENPLLRCGLLLAGANHRVETAGATGGNQGLDGVLTGLEIVGADLQGTSLVVLSACETALGQVQSGEGVAGLRQAFQLAGARSVVATLWQIPDAESSRLMIGFFSHLTSGLGPASALRQAQLDELHRRRQAGGAAHPYYWAAFTLTGQPGASWASEPVGDDVKDTPVRELVAQGPSVDRPRPLDAPPPSRPAVAAQPSGGSSPPPSRPAVAAQPSGASSPPSGASSPLPLAAAPPEPTNQPGRTDTDNPFVDGAVLIAVLVCAVAAGRWWWLRGPPGPA